MTALRADSLRSSAVIFAALASPPFLPPFLPRAERYLRSSTDTFAMSQAYTKSALVVKRRFPLTYVGGLRMISGVMNVLAQDEKLAVIAALVEGNSIRSTERMTGTHRDTIMRLSVRAGEGCARLLNERIRNARAQRVQVDEIWTFVFVKQARLNGHHDHAAMGDQCVFVGMDSDSKLVISHLVGKRDAGTATEFMQDLSGRLASRVQPTTDGFKPYIPAVEGSFGADVDYAQLVKLYGQPKANGESRDWYSPVQVMAAIPTRVAGRPNPKWVSTSYTERQNLTIRMQVRRFTRLTNGLSKKLENLKAAIALHFAHYNFVRIHHTLRVTPAMAAGLADHVWTLEELFA
jgi:IS1 family transposase